jgi:hypothetical protein
VSFHSERDWGLKNKMLGESKDGDAELEVHNRFVLLGTRRHLMAIWNPSCGMNVRVFYFTVVAWYMSG